MARDYQYYFSQLRRIEDHREKKAEKEIRKLYKNILKETRQYIAEEYYQLAEQGKLTFEILRSKSMDARFLQEVEEKLGDLSIDVSREIKKTVEEMYQLSYNGLRDAIEKGKDSKELQEFFQGLDSNAARTAWASVDNTIMDIALEKNHKENIWNIKREVATALTVGDRFETMADRIAQKLNGNYKKAILISRTEVGRVREAGHLASATELNDALKDGQSGLRMVKQWKSMRDGRVRDQHQSMHDKVVEMDEPFELPDGTETQAPKQSGVARHDCNCRCTCLYPLMDDEEFFEATGKHFDENPVENTVNRGYNNPKEMLRKQDDPRAGYKFISEKQFNDLTIEARKNGAIIIRGGAEIEEHLDAAGASASVIGNMLLFRQNVRITEVLEETHHFMQNRANMNVDKGEPLRSILNEIEAKEFLLQNAKKYNIPRKEIDLTKRQLASYKNQLKKHMSGR